MMNRRLTLIFLFVFGAMLGMAGETALAAAGDKGFVYDAHSRRDPFWKLVSPTGAILTHENDLTAADLTLEGILVDGSGKSIAVINGRVVKEKEVLGVFVVKNITTDTVVLQKGLDIFTLKLKKED